MDSQKKPRSRKKNPPPAPPPSQTLLTLENAPRSVQALEAVSGFQLRMLVVGLGGMVTDEQKMRWHNLASSEERAAYVLTFLEEWDRKKGKSMYIYSKEKPKIFTDEGINTFTTIRDHVRTVVKTSGAITMEKAMSACGGDSFVLMACVDLLLERGELLEVMPGGAPSHQYRLFIPCAAWR